MNQEPKSKRKNCHLTKKIVILKCMMMQSSGEIWPNVIVIQTSIKGKSCREMQKLTVKANNVKHTPRK